jgi:hypothetical protein
MLTYSVYGVFPNGTAIPSPAQPLGQAEAVKWGEHLYAVFGSLPPDQTGLVPAWLAVRHNPALGHDSLRWFWRLAAEAGVRQLDATGLAAVRALASERLRDPGAVVSSLEETLQQMARFDGLALGEWLGDIGLARLDGEAWALIDGPELAMSIVAHGHGALLAPLFRYEIGGEPVHSSGLTIGPGYCDHLAVEGTRVRGSFYFAPEKVRREMVLDMTPAGIARVDLSFDWDDVRDLVVEITDVRSWDVEAARRANAAPRGKAYRPRPAKRENKII